jgi:hypothetical protein
MAYVQVPKDLTRVKTKVMFNLTKRQLICFSLAGIVGIPFYLLTRHALGSTLSACMMIVLVLPFFLFAMYEKDGRPLEKVLMNIIQMKFQRPGIRPYKTENFYSAIQKEIYEKEERGFDKSDGKCAGKKKTGNDKRKNQY